MLAFLLASDAGLAGDTNAGILQHALIDFLTIRLKVSASESPLPELLKHPQAVLAI
jgi:hypothetical protein